MKKLALFAVLAVFATASFAATTSSSFGGPQGNPPQGGPNGNGGPGGGMMDNLTDEQKTCVEAAGCTQAQVGKLGTEMTDEDKAAMEETHECMKQAFEDCGIEMPEPSSDGQFGPQGGPNGNSDNSQTERGVKSRS